MMKSAMKPVVKPQVQSSAGRERLSGGYLMRRGVMTLGGILSLLYLLNPTAGIFELLPDALPIIGNIDEALAVTLLLASLREYGIDFTNWRGGFKAQNPDEGPKPASGGKP